MRWDLAWVVAVAVAAPAAAQDPAPAPVEPSDQVRYSVEIRLDPAGLARYEFDHFLHNLPNPTCTVEVGAQARDAYQRMTRAMLRAAPPGTEGLVLEVAVTGADVDADVGGARAVVGHAVLLRSASGTVVGQWQLNGEAPVLGLGSESLVAAFARAAAAAAGRLEERLDGSAAFAAWLFDRRVALVDPAARRPVARREPLFVPAPRAPGLAFVDLGIGALWSDSVAVLPALRAGVSAPWITANVTADGWSVPFSATPPAGSDAGRGKTEVVALGLDAAWSRPFGDRYRGRVGLGVQHLWARATLPSLIPAFGVRSTTVVQQQTAGSLFAGLRIIGPAVGRVGLHADLEARLLFATLSKVFGTDVAIGGLFLGALLGVDLPLWGAPTAAGAPP